MIKDDFLSGIFYSVPNLRFPNFCTPWKIIPISNLLQFQNGINGSPEQYGKGVKFISVGDILNNIYITYDNIKGLIDIDEKTLNNYSVTYGDILFQRSSEIINDIGRTNVYLDKNNIATFGGFVIRGKKIGQYNPVFFNYLLKSPSSRKSIIRLGAGAQHYNIGQENIKTLNFCFPDEIEQAKIACLFSKIDERIQIQIKIIDSIKSQKQQIRNILFNDIHQTPNCCVQDYVAYEQPQKYIVHDSNYLPYSKVLIPVLTANQSFILGYTSENDGIYKKGDCIIFDDFTNESKYVNFPFKVKSSALKILQTKEGLLLKFFYEYLQFLNFEAINHKRHYLSEVAITEINVPDLKKQSYVCKVLSSVDIKLKNEEIILKNYKLQKHFLLANLFV